MQALTNDELSWNRCGASIFATACAHGIFASSWLLQPQKQSVMARLSEENKSTSNIPIEEHDRLTWEALMDDALSNDATPYFEHLNVLALHALGSKLALIVFVDMRGARMIENDTERKCSKDAW
jgi:hypothetical protein